MSIFTRLATFAAVAATLAAPAAASADSVISPAGVITAPCSEVRDTDSTYNVRLCGVTDVDQFRTGLLNDGNAYCGPTSLFNVMQYIGRQVGAPLGDGLGDKITEFDPANPLTYYNTTIQLEKLGTHAQMTATGSKAIHNREAFMSYASASDDTGWSYATGVVDSNATAEFGYELAKRLRYAPVQLWYGRYISTQSSPSTIMHRDGGHAITVVSAKGTVGSGEVELTAMDPGRAPDHKVGDYKNTQSTYTLQTIKLKKVSFYESYKIMDSDHYVGLRKVTRWQVSGPTYEPGNGLTGMAEEFSWYAAVPPVG
jgi:hypothetical protein